MVALLWRDIYLSLSNNTAYEKEDKKMRGYKIKTGILKMMLAAALMLMAVGVFAVDTAFAKEKEMMLGDPYKGYFHAAKGGPIVYKVTSAKGKIEYLNTTTYNNIEDGEEVSEGVKVTVKGSKITIIISDDSSKLYRSHFKIGKKKYYILTCIGENAKTEEGELIEITKKEFDLPVTAEFEGKKYSNFVDIACAWKIPNMKGQGLRDAFLPEYSKKEIQGIKKTCRGIAMDKSCDISKVYPSFEADDTQNNYNAGLYQIYNDEKASVGIWQTVARYYDKKSKRCISKHIYLSTNKKGKRIAKAVAYLAYDPYDEGWVYEI